WSVSRWPVVVTRARLGLVAADSGAPGAVASRSRARPRARQCIIVGACSAAKHPSAQPRCVHLTGQLYRHVVIADSAARGVARPLPIAANRGWSLRALDD